MSAANSVVLEINLNSKLFNNVVEGIPDNESITRLNERGNHLRWLAGHLTGIRYRFTKRLGGQVEDYPHSDKYVLKDVPVPPNARPLDTQIEYPRLAETLAHWNKVSPVLTGAIERLKEEELTFSPPTGGNTLLDGLLFLAYHESYHLGQMSMLRTCMGHSPLSFK